MILSEQSTFSSGDYYTSNLKICRLESEPNLNVTTATILVVDRKASLAIEKVNDLSERFIEADLQHLDKQTQSFIDATYKNAFRIQKLTKDILDVTRIESHTLRLNKTKFSLSEVIVNAIEDTKLVLIPETNQVKIEFKNMRNAGDVVSHSQDIFIVGDRNRITQVISNLLENALKYTSEGVVSVGVARKIRHLKR